MSIVLPKGNKKKILKYNSSEASLGETKTLAIAGGEIHKVD